MIRYQNVDLFRIHELIDQQDQLIEKIPNDLFHLHSNLKLNTQPNLDLVTAIDVLLTGKYRQLPLILNRMIPSVPDSKDQETALRKLDQMIQLKLFCDDNIPPELIRCMKVSSGLVEFHVPNMFLAHLTLLVGQDSWRIMKLEILVESDSTEYEG
jgi:hypothetical protein